MTAPVILSLVILVQFCTSLAAHLTGEHNHEMVKAFIGLLGIVCVVLSFVILV